MGQWGGIFSNFCATPEIRRNVVIGFPGVFSGPFGTETWNIIPRIKP